MILMAVFVIESKSLEYKMYIVKERNIKGEEKMRRNNKIQFTKKFCRKSLFLIIEETNFKVFSFCGF